MSFFLAHTGAAEYNSPVNYIYFQVLGRLDCHLLPTYTPSWCDLWHTAIVF